MPPTGPIRRYSTSRPNEPITYHWRCACGAEAESIDITTFSDMEPSSTPGALLENCTCPKCIGCGWALDADGRCDNLDCRYVGLLILLPD